MSTYGLCTGSQHVPPLQQPSALGNCLWCLRDSGSLNGVCVDDTDTDGGTAVVACLHQISGGRLSVAACFSTKVELK